MEKRSLLSYLSEVKDSRRAEGKRHHQSMVLLIVVMATMSHYYGYRGIYRFISKNQYELIKQLKIPKDRLPSLATLYRIISNLDFQDLALKFRQWSSQFYLLEQEDWICFDGKSLRNTVSSHNDHYQNFVSIVSAYSQKTHLVLGMEMFHNREKSEMEVVDSLIECLDIKGAIYTMDALHTTQKKLDY